MTAIGAEAAEVAVALKGSPAACPRLDRCVVFDDNSNCA